MTIRRKIQIEDAIDKGAGVKEESLENDELVTISLRLKKSMLTKLNECVKKKVGMHRNGWILQAIDKQMEYQRYER